MSSLDPSTRDRHDAFEKLAAEVVEPVRRYLARRTDAATADDALAEVLLVCWRRLDDVPAEPLPWVYVVARQCLANATRGARRQARLATRIATVDPPATSAPEHDRHDEADERVHRALAAMRPADAELLRLWAWEQLDHAEIAVVLDVTPNAASIRLHRARQKFKDAMRKQGERGGHQPVNQGRTT